MRQRRLKIGLAGTAIVALTLAGSVSAAYAEQEDTEPIPQVEVEVAGAAQSMATTFNMPSSYPFQPRLTFYKDNLSGPNGEAEFFTKHAGLVSHPDIAPRLTALMEKSDRVSAQTIGQSTEGRDLYLVTVTAPESEAVTAQQREWKEKIRNNPSAAKTDTALLSGYKTPLWISNNIHGNEWEGTDASLDYIEYLATTDSPEVEAILAKNRLYFSPTLNPDGRTNSTRATALGLNQNRDMVTLSTPEARSYVETANAIQPIYAMDIHGYTRVLQVEPTGPPHGSNYEYDLILPHNYAFALAIEKSVTDPDNLIPNNTYLSAIGHQPDPQSQWVTTTPTENIRIPYRDYSDGWDDYPPIFTAGIAPFYGAMSSTVELPKSRADEEPISGKTMMKPSDAVINKANAYRTIEVLVDYFNDPTVTTGVLKNQMTIFERGVQGTPIKALKTTNISDVPGPDQWKSVWDATHDQEEVTLPRAYVIPVGTSQRSASDANRLVQRLLDVGVEVGTLNANTAVGGKTYPKGSYVIDMHQPLRGLANVLLDLGEDVSQKLPTMYDISAWSLGKLWGATVDKVGSTTDAATIGAVTKINAPTSGSSSPKQGSYLTFDLAGIADYQAVNELLAQGVAVSMLADGSVVIAAANAPLVAEISTKFNISIASASNADLLALDAPTTKGLKHLKILYAGNEGEVLSLSELGFDDLTQITAASVTSDPSLLNGADVIWVGSDFEFTPDQNKGFYAVQNWVNAGGSIVGSGSAANNAANAFGLLQSTAIDGNEDSNGIVAVDTPSGSILEPFKQDVSFIYPATWFTDLGANTKTEQTYASGNPLLAGHWRQTASPSLDDGPQHAAGKASAISSVNATSGAKALVFGTSVFFRNHPKGGFSQAARALYWAASEGAKVAAPDATLDVDGLFKADKVTLQDGITQAEINRVKALVDAMADSPKKTALLQRVADAQKQMSAPPRPCLTPGTVAVFLDTPVGHKFYKEIDWMSCMKLTTGIKVPGGKNYAPKDPLSREAMAAFIYRLEDPKGYVTPAVSPFADVAPGHKFYKEITWMHAAGLSTGTRQPTGKPLYAPKQTLSREAMAAFIYRLQAKTDEQAKKYVAPKSSQLLDMKPGAKFYKEINWMYDAKLTTGFKTAAGKEYQPKSSLSREAMAAFIYRLKH